jgi:hypothetical protein
MQAAGWHHEGDQVSHPSMRLMIVYTTPLKPGRDDDGHVESAAQCAGRSDIGGVDGKAVASAEGPNCCIERVSLTL